MNAKKRKLFTLAAFVLLVLIACAVYVGGLVRRGFSTRKPPGARESSFADAVRDWAIPNRCKTMKNPVTVTPEVIHEGMAHWADHCATCHANNGDGDTMYGRTMYPRPPDMRQKETQEISDGELYYTIKNGIRLSAMPSFVDPGDDDLDSWTLVAFIRHLPNLSDQEEMRMEHINPKSPKRCRRK